ncbi:hypothetical protein ACSBL2_24610 [Pedobacter sp. AW31-3R]|uniref:hypothetical protein n=1 Tax=Pedobacter sp. AW31-3R TaxID=3445781 RepID=UPI003F9F6946
MKDILLDDNLDLAFEGGDFIVGDAEDQHQQLILLASQGSFRESPLTGINIISYMKTGFNRTQVDELKQKCRVQLQYDGYANAFIQINSFEDIQINAER